MEDQGSVLSQVIEGLKQHGACAETSWPFAARLVNERPSEEAYDRQEVFSSKAPNSCRRNRSEPIGVTISERRLDAWSLYAVSSDDRAVTFTGEGFPALLECKGRERWQAYRGGGSVGVLVSMVGELESRWDEPLDLPLGARLCGGRRLCVRVALGGK